MLTKEQFKNLVLLFKLNKEDYNNDEIEMILVNKINSHEDKNDSKNNLNNDLDGIESTLYNLKIQGYTKNQLEVIRKALEENLPIDELLCIDKEPEALDLILKGIRNNYDTYLYSDGFNLNQMNEIVSIMDDDLPAKLIAKVYYSSTKMKLYHKALKYNIYIMDLLDRDIEESVLEDSINRRMINPVEPSNNEEEICEEDIDNIDYSGMSFTELKERFW